jgi:hypothetical protein
MLHRIHCGQEVPEQCTDNRSHEYKRSKLLLRAGCLALHVQTHHCVTYAGSTSDYKYGGAEALSFSLHV